MHDPDQQLLYAAIDAYFRSGQIDQPANYSGVHTHDGRDYVVLRNRFGTLAMYLVGDGDTLEALDMDKWPDELDYV